MDRLVALIERYAGFFTEEKDNTPDFQDDQNAPGNRYGDNKGNRNHIGHAMGYDIALKKTYYQ
ncbi:MAG: hypothetical protein BWX72_01845 [Firmicutes bacterium ADurb.Bin080]|nr:MAG: hypothetical protein BWX72_01845 [Firmicutes bacterium ADurb.Bin080]